MSGTSQLHLDGPAHAPATVILAHGANAGMDTPFMEFFAQGLAEGGYRVARFEFPYMAQRRQDGGGELARGSHRPSGLPQWPCATCVTLRDPGG